MDEVFTVTFIGSCNAEPDAAVYCKNPSKFPSIVLFGTVKVILIGNV